MNPMGQQNQMNNQMQQMQAQSQTNNQINPMGQQNQMCNPMNNQMGFQSQVGLGNNMSNNPMMNQGTNQMPNNQMNQFMQQQQQAAMLQQQQQQQQQQAAMLAQQTMMQQAMQQQAMQQQAAMMQQAMLAQQQQQAMMQQAMLAQQQKMAQMQTILDQNNKGQSPNTAPFGSSQNAQPQGNGISVIFRTSGQNAPQRPPISIQCMPDEKVSTLIERYRNKADDHDQTKKFIFNAKNLNPSLTLSAAGIAHNSNIFVVTTKGVQGAI